MVLKSPNLRHSLLQGPHLHLPKVLKLLMVLKGPNLCHSLLPGLYLQINLMRALEWWNLHPPKVLKLAVVPLRDYKSLEMGLQRE
jgi:hypothetical protein